MYTENTNLKERVSRLEELCSKQADTIDENVFATKCSTEKLNDLEQYTRKDSIRIRGIDDFNKGKESVERQTWNEHQWGGHKCGTYVRDIFRG